MIFEYSNMQGTITGQVEAEYRYEAVQKINKKEGIEVDGFWVIEAQETLNKYFG